MKMTADELRKAVNRQKIQAKRYKVATYGLGEGGASGGDIIGMAPEYWVPQLENSSLELPKYRREIFNWCDFYHSTDPLIGTAIDTHATFSVADFAISCKNPTIQAEYEQILEELNYQELLNSIALEYFRVGNVFPMGQFDETELTWKEFTLIPPIFMEIERNILGGGKNFFLNLENAPPTENNENVNNELPEEMRQLRDQKGRIKLDLDAVSHISTPPLAGTLWGVPPMYRCFKTLIYKDKLYRAQEAIADGHVTPKRIISLTANDGLPVTEDEMVDFRDQLMQSETDPSYYILTSANVQDKSFGSSGRILSTSNEVQYIENMITSGMKINKALLHGEGPTYSNAQVYQNAMIYYYQNFRSKLSYWLRNFVFKRIAKSRGYYETVTTESSTLDVTPETKKLILPEIIWRGTGLMDSQTVGIIKDLWREKKISTETLINTLVPDLDYKSEQSKLLEESSGKLALDNIAPALSKEVTTPYESYSDQLSEKQMFVDKALDTEERPTKPKDTSKLPSRMNQKSLIPKKTDTL